MDANRFERDAPWSPLADPEPTRITRDDYNLLHAKISLMLRGLNTIDALGVLASITGHTLAAVDPDGRDALLGDQMTATGYFMRRAVVRSCDT